MVPISAVALADLELGVPECSQRSSVGILLTDYLRPASNLSVTSCLGIVFDEAGAALSMPDQGAAEGGGFAILLLPKAPPTVASSSDYSARDPINALVSCRTFAFLIPMDLSARAFCASGLPERIGLGGRPPFPDLNVPAPSCRLCSRSRSFLSRSFCFLRLGGNLIVERPYFF